LVTVYELARYEVKVDRYGEPDNLDRKKGMAVMTTMEVSQNVQQNKICRDAPFQDNSTEQPRMK